MPAALQKLKKDFTSRKCRLLEEERNPRRTISRMFDDVNENVLLALKLYFFI
jgi:hypothetical protein